MPAPPISSPEPSDQLSFGLIRPDATGDCTIGFDDTKELWFVEMHLRGEPAFRTYFAHLDTAVEHFKARMGRHLRSLGLDLV